MQNKPILQHISVQAAPGEVVFVLGESGAGKSTLLRILNSLEKKDTGTIALNGKELDKKAVTLVFQHFNLFENLTVLQNITLALEKVQHKNVTEAKDIAQELLQKYKLEDRAAAFVHALSGGQKQRLAIARALAINPSVICLDEPTSALDPALSNYIAQELQQLAVKQCIVIVATHDMNLVLNTKANGTVYLLDKGQIVETASLETIHKDAAQLKYLKTFMQGEGITLS